MQQRTQVAIIGAGPAGLLLGALLQKAGIASTILERDGDEQVLERVRAGILEPGTAALIDAAGVGARMRREALVHRGIGISFGGERRRIDLQGLSGRSVLVYGQTELTRDLMQARAAAGQASLYQVEQVSLHDYDDAQPRVRFRHQGRDCELACEFIAGCDGFHGASRASLPSRAYRCYERGYPFGWLGVLADSEPPSEELIYAQSERGFALCSMRSRSRVRCYIQCSLSDKVEQWSDARFWDELRLRLDPASAAALRPAPALEKSIAPLRSYVAEPLRFGRLFLAGDAGHLVPPAGAKGLNLAAADAHQLARALIEHYRDRSDRGLDRYSELALRRIWRAERFSWGMTRLLHHFPDHNGFDQRIQQAELDYLFDSRAAQTALAENYVGLPLD
ncbi:MAG TPA: 4-hydroxybenzoate 3-monooxygenase [Roseateles sp.]|nr:4-hydroxybenzoate 3-monooxygenase [Roseateles sp.]